ncbi:hypothetical protein NBRC10512_006498 [Rhodotorula toruloides]|uniref:RHTO0S01e03554g1_1 n=2 Tax=Rhodotorula toruloides TaxID=5286 RepID=A0A061ADJ0_RHOTO|nr:DUF1445 domain containing protein [Rhodotorula toruloides NP11]EMS19714.1 DUF1445 domain containing protein [Rhodotorula toruloides NP11]KAJ8292169.1 putative hydro-lyase C5H10.01 [Rhodotorula toruloides]CDR35626.1 RHTO0S01e03554g1_1 [Rhodotorula toruloides]
MTVAATPLTPHDVRLACRKGTWKEASTAGICEGYVQANLIILPERYAADFRALCARNPVPCPLLGETKPGNPTIPAHLAKDCDIRTDAPQYNVYLNGKLVETKRDIKNEWKEDSVGFLVGCSFSFEAALVEGGYTPRQIEIKRNVPMYKTKVPLCAAGALSGNMVVSMRPYPPSAIETVRDLTRPFIRAHGEPVAWGPEGAAALGVDDPTGANPDFGEASEVREGEVPVYWACGVTPQSVVMASKIEGVVLGHAPGHMLVLDMRDEDVCK